MVDEQQQTTIPREPPDAPESRAEFVKSWHKTIKEARDDKWDKVFKQMREDMAFARGNQWSNNSDDDRYICNLVLRHIQKRTAALYAKNPRAIAEPRQRMEYAVWDENPESLQMAQDPNMMGNPELAAALQYMQADAINGTLRKKQYDRIARTLEYLFTYYLNEDIPPFKQQAKQLVRRVLTTGVGFLKLDFRRATELSPDYYDYAQDALGRLAELERIAQDVADDELDPETSKEMEQLKLQIEQLQAQNTLVLNEGLVFRFPKSTHLIVDPACYQLKGFLGAGWIAQEYYFKKEEVQKIYNVDVGTNFAAYSQGGKGNPMSRMTDPDQKDALCCVWELYDLETGLRLQLCDGYEDLLSEDYDPPVHLEQGHPYFCLSFNDLEDDECIYPPSDVSLLRHQQKEYNRSRESLREHRIANKPAWISPKGVWDEKDLNKIGNHLAHELMQLNIPMSPNLDINRMIMAKPTAPIDPNLYNVDYLFTDILRGIGDHEATFGGGSGDTATEISVAETSRVSSIESNVDDLDDFLTQMARASGQILLLNMSKQQVMKIVGPGAVWPELSAQEVADELVLQIQAGSSGRPNKAQELANAERVMPYLIQIPGMNPRWLAEQMLNRMDDKMDLAEAFTEGMPSIIAMNAMAKGGGGMDAGGGGAGSPASGASQEDKPSGESVPAAQGDNGGNNAENPQQTSPGPQPAYPAQSAGGMTR